MKKIIILCFFLFSAELSFADFKSRTAVLEFSKDVERQVRALCTQYCDTEIKNNPTKKEEFIKKTLKNVLLEMENEYKKKFSKQETEYLEKLLSHHIMRKLYDFKMEFIGSLAKEPKVKDTFKIEPAAAQISNKNESPSRAESATNKK